MGKISVLTTPHPSPSIKEMERITILLKYFLSSAYNGVREDA